MTAQMTFPVEPRSELLSGALLTYMLIVLGLAVLIKYIYAKLLKQDVNIFLHRSYNINARLNAHSDLYQNYFIWSCLLFVCAASVFLLLCNTQLDLFRMPADKLAATVPLCAAGVLVFYGAKSAFALFFGRIIHEEYRFRQYLGYMWLTLRITGIILVPCILVLPFLSPDWSFQIIRAVVILFGAVTILRWLKGAFGNLGAECSIIYFILYLCTFEFTPLLIAWKLWFSEL